MSLLDVHLLNFSVSVDSPILGTALGFVAGLVAASLFWFKVYTTQSRVYQVGMALNDIERDIRAEDTCRQRAALASLNDLRSRQQVAMTMTGIVLASVKVEPYAAELLMLETETSRMRKKTRLLSGGVIVRQGAASAVDLNDVDIADGIEEV